MFCDACGNKNEDGYIFCEKCGTKLLESNEDLECNEAIEHLKYEGYDIIGIKGTQNSRKIKEQIERKYSTVQKSKETQSTLNDGNPFGNNQVQVNNKPKSNNTFYDREAYIKEFQNDSKGLNLSNTKNKNKSKILLIIIEIIVLIAIIIIGYLLYNM